MSITNLNPAFPPDDEQLSEGAGRIRDIKEALASTFPGFDKTLPASVDSAWLNSIATVITATQDALTFYPKTTTDTSVSMSFLKDGSVEILPSGLIINADGTITTKTSTLLNEKEVLDYLQENVVKRAQLSDKLSTAITDLEDKLSKTIAGTSTVSLDLSSQVAQARDLKKRLDALIAFPQTIAKQIKDYFKVGDIYITQDVADPSTKFDGFWEKLEEGCTLASTTATLGNSDPINANVNGSNTVPIKSPKHKHSIIFTGNDLPPHANGLSAYRRRLEQDTTGNILLSGFTTIKPPSNLNTTQEVIPHERLTFVARPGASTFDITKREFSNGSGSQTPTGKITVNDYASSKTNLDVRGKRMPVYVWKRVL